MDVSSAAHAACRWHVLCHQRGLGVKYKPVRNYCKSKDCEKFLVHIISPIFKIANLISQWASTQNKNQTAVHECWENPKCGQTTPPMCLLTSPQATYSHAYSQGSANMTFNRCWCNSQRRKVNRRQSCYTFSSFDNNLGLLMFGGKIKTYWLLLIPCPRK